LGRGIAGESGGPERSRLACAVFVCCNGFVWRRRAPPRAGCRCYPARTPRRKPGCPQPSDRRPTGNSHSSGAISPLMRPPAGFNGGPVASPRKLACIRGLTAGGRRVRTAGPPLKTGGFSEQASSTPPAGKTSRNREGTGGSNPSSSSAESVANRFLRRGETATVIPARGKVGANENRHHEDAGRLPRNRCSNPASSSGESQENRIFGRCRSGVT
jgi:hypothetical protein